MRTKEQIVAYRKARYERLKEQQKEQSKQYHYAHKEERSAYQKQFWTDEGIGVYAWKDKVDGTVVYVGSGYLKQRQRATTNKTAITSALKEIFEQNGVDRYEFVELEQCNGDKTELKLIEQKWINELKPTLNKNKAIRTKDEDREYRNRKWREMYQRNKK